jgi:hypothetical protein
MELTICIIVVYILWKAVRMQTSGCDEAQDQKFSDNKKATYTYTLDNKTTSTTRL